MRFKNKNAKAFLTYLVIQLEKKNTQETRLINFISDTREATHEFGGLGRTKSNYFPCGLDLDLSFFSSAGNLDFREFHHFKCEYHLL